LRSANKAAENAASQNCLESRRLKEPYTSLNYKHYRIEDCLVVLKFGVEKAQIK